MNREDNLQIIENSVTQETYKKIVSRNYSDDVLNYISGYGPTIEVFADTKYKTETVHKLADALSNHRISTYDMMDIMKGSVNSAKNEPYTDDFIKNIGITNFRENMAAFLTSNTADVSYNDIISGLSSGIYEENTVGRLQINDMLASEMRKAGIQLAAESYEDVNYTPVQKHILCERINYMRKSPDWEKVCKSFAEPIISEKKEIFSEYCKPLDSDDDPSGKLLILAPEALNEDNQNKAMLFFYAESAVPSVVDDRPMIVSGKYLADDIRARYDLDDILGIADRDKLPAWAENKLRTLEKEQLEIKQTAYDENMAAYSYINGLDDHDEPSEQDDDDYSYENLSHSIFLDEIKDQYADFRDNTLRMTAKDIFAAAYEITAKTAIKEKLVNEDLMLSDEQETALMQSDNMLDEIYQDWLKTDSEDFTDLPTVIVNTAEYRRICSSLEKQNINDSAVVYEETDDTPAVSTCRGR